MSPRASVAVRLAEQPGPAASSSTAVEPCTLVIFGAGGDLTRRKLLPAVCELLQLGLLPPTLTVIGVARDPYDDASFRAAMERALEQFAHEAAGKDVRATLVERLSYLSGDLDDTKTYAALRRRIEEAEARTASRGRLFYLAIPPSVYPDAIRHLHDSGIAPRQDEAATRPWVRIIIEKPFGHSLESAQALNAIVRQAFAEHQVYRIDHYLGKETVQNLLVFRFANSIFEPVWNRQHVHHVQITAAESVGVEHRGRYYEEAGVVRDMFQNHLLQLVTLMAMEPPVTFSADAVRDEKVKVLRAIRPIAPHEMHDYLVRGQYGPGQVHAQLTPGYREEPNVAPDSGIATYAAARFMIDNWRWHGVPFYLRSGKRMPRRVTEIAIQFREPPHLLFPLAQALQSNVLAIRVQPNEGIALRFEVKVPGPEVKTASADMDFDYRQAFSDGAQEAYATLLLDCMRGDATLFTRADEVEVAWSIVDPIIEFWKQKRPEHFPNYAAGSWGPEVADTFIARFGAAWRKP
jgi:glucose-6-phosphate 1-dehydrogenase